MIASTMFVRCPIVAVALVSGMLGCSQSNDPVSGGASGAGGGGQSLGMSGTGGGTGVAGSAAPPTGQGGGVATTGGSASGGGQPAAASGSGGASGDFAGGAAGVSGGAGAAGSASQGGEAATAGAGGVGGSTRSLGCGQPFTRPNAGDLKSISVGGQNRAYQLFVPASYSADIAHPLVVTFHGGGGSAASSRAEMHLESANSPGLVVYLNFVNGAGATPMVRPTSRTIKPYGRWSKTLSASIPTACS